MLALDFDGVVCDALTECASVTWYAGHHEGDFTSIPGLPDAVDAVPAWFIEHFRTIRDFSRTLDDFMVANTVTEPISTRAEFERAKEAAGPDQLARLATVAEAVRATWRERDLFQWISLHALYPGIAALLRHSSQPVAIVSAKDEASIREILEFHDLTGNVTEVIGSCSDKRAAVATLMDDGADTGSPVVFVDDNLTNVISVSSLPVTARWATWGYHTPEDVRRAKDYSTSLITLETLHELLPIAELVTTQPEGQS